PDKNELSVFAKAIETVVILLAPFTPHVCEEMWELIGKKQMISEEAWPKHNKKEIDEKAENYRQFAEKVVDDVKSIKKILQSPAKKITVYVAPKWKHEVYALAEKKPKNLVAEIMKNPDIKKQGKDAVKFAQALSKRPVLVEVLSAKDEMSALTGHKNFLEQELKAEIEILPAEGNASEKAKRAEPGKPGIEII
ncbi:MAG: class I tRNA ligase family protein, partial [Candidatus Aenigmarchaeota archaeon]|nr:class I tRNA ligase family protein [Candidatus Aenigmarchaeota archaeon]